MQTNAKRFFEEGNGIKANPILKALYTARFLYLLTAIIWLVLFIFFFLISMWAPHFSGYPIVPFSAFIGVIGIFNFAMSTAQVRYWKRIEQRRFALIQGDRIALAAEQPRQNVASMRLPLTIKLRYTKEFAFLLTGVILLMALLIAGTFSLNSPWFFTSNALLFFLVIFFVSAALLIVLMFVLLIFSSGRQQIEVTENGITAWYGGKAATVRWEEACLLAMYNAFGAQKSGAAITYELSSARDIVRWTWAQRKTYFVSQGPTVSLDEHNGQMQELLAVVEVKTGLPLYDLRH
jgi:hypothetical protein